MKYPCCSTIFVLLLMLLTPADTDATSRDGYKWSAGLSGLGSSIGGIGIKFDYTRQLALHGVIGNGLGMQGRFAIESRPRWDMYLAGHGGFHSSSGNEVFLGGAVGFDLDLHVLSEEIPPVSFGLELGAGTNGFGIGGALHWNF